MARTFLFTVLAVGVETVLGPGWPWCFSRQFAGKGLVKLLLLLPLVATPVAIGIVWNLFYDPTIGLANFLLRLVGLGAMMGLRRAPPSSPLWSSWTCGSGRP